MKSIALNDVAENVVLSLAKGLIFDVGLEAGFGAPSFLSEYQKVLNTFSSAFFSYFMRSMVRGVTLNPLCTIATGFVCGAAKQIIKDEKANLKQILKGAINNGAYEAIGSLSHYPLIQQFSPIVIEGFDGFIGGYVKEAPATVLLNAIFQGMIVGFTIIGMGETVFNPVVSMLQSSALAINPAIGCALGTAIIGYASYKLANAAYIYSYSNDNGQKAH